ncbi:DNA replication and repair protein RecF [Branchiibius hedensis]|uniref:DNA replication and repair protein RecF n=1 Tax=Branchiibius hedensis TaxID=672460 RepID=A0A2Y9A0V6_9MICO|nr:DNA replication/repair protein RecF [Branchiibius hedensis]PWJ26996.1 DNA replication and repair protein RecF [Branchiibius hedensis]SSA35807.1 DNA replication and repair protein RecF [Branchiibius hedensis]
MYVAHLVLTDFRSYDHVDLALAAGPSLFVGQNGQGKTNLVEAIGYVASMGSHRVASDGPLIRAGTGQAVISTAVVRDGRTQQVELEINPGRANRARLNAHPTRPRETLGTLRTVLFAPEDLALVKGDPEQRRRFLDDLLVARQPRWSAARSDYDKILKQRNALLKSARTAPDRSAVLASLPAWNEHLATAGAHLLYARLRLLRDLAPHVAQAYDQVSAGAGGAHATYRSSLDPDIAEPIAAGQVPTVEELTAATHARFAQVAQAEADRGLTLVGPHRDDVELELGDLPAKGYASHGESWSFALALRLAAYQLLRHDLGTDPVLVLDDVFAELDTGRRERLAALIEDCEQVLVTAAVPADIPQGLVGPRFEVTRAAVSAITVPQESAS